MTSGNGERNGDGAGAPPPTGRFSRFLKLTGLSTGMLGTSAVGAVRKAFAGGAQAAAVEAETRLKNAARAVATMGELKGAVMKLGQVISIQEDAVPKEFRDVLSRLQLKSGETQICDNLLRCYEALVAAKVFPSAELAFVELWLENLRLAGKKQGSARQEYV